jgi:hypothetical protein
MPQKVVQMTFKDRKIYEKKGTEIVDLMIKGEYKDKLLVMSPKWENGKIVIRAVFDGTDDECRDFGKISMDTKMSLLALKPYFELKFI